MVYVVGANDSTSQLLQQVVFFVGAFGGGEESNAVWAVAVAYFAQAGSNGAKGNTPGGRLENGFVIGRFFGSQQGMVETVGGVNVVVAKPAFDTQKAVIDVVIETAVCPVNHAIFHKQINLAAYPTIGAGSGNHIIRL